MDEDATWYGSGCRPRLHCIRWVPAPRERDTAAPSFQPMSVVAAVAHFSCCWALYSYAVNGDPGVSDCQSVGVLAISSHPRSFLLRSRPLTAASRSLGEGISSPAGPGRARPPNVFWCIVGINFHLFDCLMTSNFLCLFFIKRMFPWLIYNTIQLQYNYTRIDIIKRNMWHYILILQLCF